MVNSVDMFKFLRKFFEPAIVEKRKSIKLMLEGSLGTIWFDIIPILSIPYLLKLIDAKDFDAIVNFSIFIVILNIFLWVLHFFIRKWDIEARQHYEMYVNSKYRKNITLKDNLESEKYGTGKIQSIVSKGIYAWVESNWQITYQIPKTFFGVISGIYITYSLGLLYLFLFFILLFFSTLGFYYFKNLKLKYDEKVTDIENELNSNSVRIIMSRQEIVNSGKQDMEIKKLNSLYLDQLKINSFSAKYDFLSDLFVSSLGTLLPFIGVIFFITLDDTSLSDIGLLISFIYFSSRFSFILYSLVWMISQTLEKYPEIKVFWQFLETVPVMKNYEEGNNFVHGNGEIEIRSIDFKYNEDFVLKNFNLKINGGEKIALVGKSGSGKTTIAKLISGFMNPINGQVLVDNQNLADLSLKSYFKYIGYLTQEPMVFDGSIKDNLLYSVKDKVSEEEMVGALKKANCDFIFKMSKGINTQIGEKGVRLSGGERQRLAIAKLFLKNPEIIILDEPTSALDSFSEEKISESLEELFKGRTTIIIAHRLQTVKKANRILVIENGEIKEEGTHEELTSKKGIYAKMLAMQSGF